MYVPVKQEDFCKVGVAFFRGGMQQRGAPFTHEGHLMKEGRKGRKADRQAGRKEKTKRKEGRQ
jgi:hypothetical protein